MDYERLPEPGAGLRLHLNENGGGCSPAVIEAIGRLSVTDMAFYPDYEPALAACSAWLGVPRDHVSLVNGLDEGIWATAVACLQGRLTEAVIVEPAFDMYAASVAAAGGQVVRVAPRAGFEFPLGELLQSIGPRCAVVYLCSPNNPTGLTIEHAAIEAAARALPPGALVFLDEAYVDFGGESFVPRLGRFPNVIVGRTFAKAHGLAALRAGCLVGQPEALSIAARAIPPYSMNVCALAAIPAALGDDRHVAAYRLEVTTSRDMVYATCDRLGLEYWRSEANFVLVRVGERAAGLVAALARRGIHIRDRSGEPGCSGCVRITAGLVDQTRTCLAAMEEALCERG
jgi:histidinol-phosphate aminotransferase